MKKALFFGMCCLATACTNDELAFEQPKNNAKGIVLAASIEGSTTANTRGELISNNNRYPFFWYAEQDRINVYADNVTPHEENTTENGVVNAWGNNMTSLSPAVYKATQSAASGWFTAVSDENWINFKNDDPIDIVATYPETTTLTGAVMDGDNKSIVMNIGKSNAAQSVNFNQIDAPMYSISEGQREKDYQSVGEKANLSFKRAFPALRFSSAEGNDQYNGILGGLKSIKVEMRGAEVDADGFSLDDSKIAATSATYSTAGVKEKDGYYLCSNGEELTVTGESGSVEANLQNIGFWNSNDYVYMSIYPVKREATKNSVTKQMTESYTVTYKYANVDLVKNLTTKSDWNIENAVYEIEALDIAKDFPYIVTNDSRLMVFSGSFSGIDANAAEINWKNEKVLKSSIKEIISDVELTTEELKTLGTKFTSLKELTLKENTEIPAGTFGKNQTAEMTKLVLPKVTKYEDENAFGKLATLELNAYEFAEDAVYKLFFNDNTKQTLVKLNIESVTSLRPTFGYDRIITFDGYEKLKTVDLNKETGVNLSDNAFRGCINLETLNGLVDITNASSAFEGASTVGEIAPVINVTGTVIPNAAFKRSNIKTIMKDGRSIVPTEIGESAFESNVKVEYMDLSSATVIGKKAFYLAENFVGKDEADSQGVVEINAKTLNDYILCRTKVKRVQFKEATTIGHWIFGRNNTELKQIKFLKKVTLRDKSSSDEKIEPFGSDKNRNVDLFVATAQDDTNGLQWLGYTFRTLTREDKVWGN